MRLRAIKLLTVLLMLTSCGGAPKAPAALQGDFRLAWTSDGWPSVEQE